MTRFAVLVLMFSSSVFATGPVTLNRPHIRPETLSQYIVIQNIATEQLRVYERCTLYPECPHRMIMETEIVVGRTHAEPDKEKKINDPNRFLTWVGRYKLTEWKKFYQDYKAHYPSWYHPDYPPIPQKPRTKQWFAKELMPNGVGSARGAFGWYTAMVEPNSNQQWIHGTYGWGRDRNKYIHYTRNLWVNIFANPRSSGCTRVENQAIAYLRHLLPVGTEIVRVYAHEGYRDPNRTAYNAAARPVAWDWVLTTEGVQKDGPDSDRQAVLERRISPASFIEQGTYAIDRYPDAKGIMPKEPYYSGKSGNTYAIHDNEFQGVYLVDEGRFIYYRHPTPLPRGGYEETELPENLRTSGDFVMAQRGPEKVDNPNSPFPGGGFPSAVDPSKLAPLQ